MAIYDRQGAADRVGRDVRTIRRWEEKGLLTFVLGRVRESDLLEAEREARANRGGDRRKGREAMDESELGAVQWRMVNHVQMKEFLGDAWIGKLNKASRIVVGEHHAHDITFRERADGTGPQLYAPLNSYIVRTPDGRFAAVDGEVFEHLAARKVSA